MLEFSLVGGNMNKSELYEYFIKIISEKDSVDIENYKNNINIVINKLLDRIAIIIVLSIILILILKINTQSNLIG